MRRSTNSNSNSNSNSHFDPSSIALPPPFAQGGAPPSCLTIPQACQQLAIGRTTLYGLLRIGAIKSVKIGKRGKRIPASEITRFLEEGCE